jgi:putative MATE family efflux protein
MSIQLSDHFTYKKLFRLTLPSVVMLVVTSIYSVVDGFFVSNFVGKTPFAAVNLIMPFLMVIGSIGFMMGTGGGALIAKTMGENNQEKANRIFSMVVYLSAAFGVALTVLGLLFLRPVACFLGAEGELLENCIRYGRMVLLATSAYILQFEFQCLFATANKPGFGLAITVAAGLTNAVLDALFVAVLPWGLEGAAAATAIGQCVGGILPVIYFARKNNSLLRLGKANFDRRALFQVCLNGSSEMLSNIATSIVGMLYNLQLLRYIGENGVAAYGVLMYLSMVFNAIFIGFSVGVAPVVSYHYGAGNTAELKNMKKKCFATVAAFSGAMFILSILLSKPLAALFVGYDRTLFDLTVHAFLVYSISFLFFGFTIYTSSFFTALNNGPVSAAVSFLRTLVFQVASVLLLPLIFDTEGIWWSVAVAEFLSLCTSICFLKVFQKRYAY